MPAPRTLPIAAALAAALLAAGCTGTTEPAGDVQVSSAQLNARGAADDGPAYSFFELTRFGADGQPQGTTTTVRRSWPAGASGPFSERVSGLATATGYGFRVCGGDQGEAPACAQTRFFATRGPAGRDSVKGSFFSGGVFPAGDVDAVSGPAGQDPMGSVSYAFGRSTLRSTFTGIVTCVAVNGSTGTVGAVGELSTTGSAPRTVTTVLTVVDRNSAGELQGDLLTIERRDGSVPQICSPPRTPTESPDGGSSLRVTDS